MGVLGDAWLIASVVITAVAAGTLIALVLPRQEELVAQVTERRLVDHHSTVQLAMFTGVFNLF
ncbi:hypothetical protein GA0115245_12596 [Streptomyces sp. di188]|nr:hypothetical protein GA0115238_10046 [Streptomyces sp. di50b]SCE21732.1 hypothetical protein GA0115245_12596 [Streptomyces sp. di188]